MVGEKRDPEKGKATVETTTQVRRKLQFQTVHQKANQDKTGDVGSWQKADIEK